MVRSLSRTQNIGFANGYVKYNNAFFKAKIFSTGH